ncbi:N-acetylmuramoyl-L-alanine amidase [Cohnella hashimotonis]|uniref:N-acetylmuramoyl-L-alanine amidase n=1 Tax=Cohnella hashimotonis TaxID=2826895 RepID=A0ABT6TK99_9BACL|nr:N-acetylmuramoyl-L-alanine amidase [Cohnella hashimotonis]MDI4647159.1 N-acetylmuramoyl-L-alanine amidase [Cohnella hashimotonis]
MKQIGFFVLLAAIFFCFSFAGQASAQTSGATIILDGQALSLQKKDKVEILKGSVMVPIRVIAENLGLLVTWNQADKQVKIWSGSGDIKLTIGSSVASVGDANVKLNAAPVNRSGTTLVPLRFVGESAGIDIGWDNVKKIVTLASLQTSEPWQPSSPTPSATPIPSPTPTVSPSPTPTPTPTATPGTSPTTSPSPAAGGQIKGIGWSDGRLAISFSGSLIPKTYAMTNPSRIVVELRDTSFDPAFASLQSYNSATQSGAFEISDGSSATHVGYAVTDTVSKTITITLDLATDKPYTAYQEADVESNVYVVDLKPTATPTPPPVNPNNGKKIVVIDPGHGDGDPGGIGATKKQEKSFNLSLALKVEKLLKKESAFQVVMTRHDDTFIPLSDRATIANKAGADAFVSIHANIAPGKPTVRGTETYYYTGNGKTLANIMHKYLVQATGFTDRKVKYASYKVLRETDMPATLLEVGFLSNATEESILFSVSFQDRVAQAIVDGLKAYFGVK